MATSSIPGIAGVLPQLQEPIGGRKEGEKIKRDRGVDGDLPTPDGKRQKPGLKFACDLAFAQLKHIFSNPGLFQEAFSKCAINLTLFEHCPAQELLDYRFEGSVFISPRATLKSRLAVQRVAAYFFLGQTVAQYEAKKVFASSAPAFARFLGIMRQNHDELLTKRKEKGYYYSLEVYLPEVDEKFHSDENPSLQIIQYRTQDSFKNPKVNYRIISGGRPLESLTGDAETLADVMTRLSSFQKILDYTEQDWNEELEQEFSALFGHPSGLEGIELPITNKRNELLFGLPYLVQCKKIPSLPQVPPQEWLKPRVEYFSGDYPVSTHRVRGNFDVRERSDLLPRTLSRSLFQNGVLERIDHLIRRPMETIYGMAMFLRTNLLQTRQGHARCQTRITFVKDCLSSHCESNAIGMLCHLASPEIVASEFRSLSHTPARNFKDLTAQIRALNASPVSSSLQIFCVNIDHATHRREQVEGIGYLSGDLGERLYPGHVFLILHYAESGIHRYRIIDAYIDSYQMQARLIKHQRRTGREDGSYDFDSFEKHVLTPLDRLEEAMDADQRWSKRVSLQYKKVFGVADEIQIDRQIAGAEIRFSTNYFHLSLPWNIVSYNMGRYSNVDLLPKNMELRVIDKEMFAEEYPERPLLSYATEFFDPLFRSNEL